MTSLSSPNLATHQPTHAFDVLIKSEPEGKVSATILNLPEYRAEGSDRTSALTAALAILSHRTHVCLVLSNL